LLLGPKIIMLLQVKPQEGSPFEIDIDLRKTVDQFKGVIEAKVDIPKTLQRLVFNGRVLLDTDTLDKYQLNSNTTLHLLKFQPKGNEEVETISGGLASMPGVLGDLQRHLLQNPDIMQQMMNSPAMQSLLNDAEFLRNILTMNPQMRELMNRHPEIQEMMNDQDFMAQSLEAFRNPSMMREMLRSTDRAMSAIDAVPGGLEMLQTMNSQIKLPSHLRGDKKGKDAKAKEEEAKEGEVPEGGAEGAEAEAAKEAEAEAEKEEKSPLDGAPPWVDKFDPNAMAAMLQDPNMQQLMASMIQAATQAGPMAHLTAEGKNAGKPFSDPNFLAQMFSPQTMTAMASMQQAMGNMSVGRTAAAKDKDGAAAVSPAVALSGLSPLSPAADFSKAFENFLKAQQENPEIQYRTQLNAMRNMGFTDTEVCVQMLNACEGNMNRAIDRLLAGDVPA